MVKFLAFIRPLWDAFGKYLMLFLLGAFLYWFGGHNQAVTTNAVDKAVNTVVTNANTRLQSVIDGQVGSINGRLQDNQNAIITAFQSSKTRTAADYDSMLNMPNAGLYVVGPTNCTPAKTGATNSGPNNTGTYRAQLSAESQRFLAGEAKRANDAVYRLTAAQATIVSFQKAVADYNAMLDKLYPDVPHVDLSK